MDTTAIEKLLNEVIKITEKYEKMALPGDNFNVFRILNLTSNETRTHSAFIAELLYHGGTHGKGNLFLIEFVNMLKEKLPNSHDHIIKEINFDAENVKEVKREHWLGYKTESEGGYIDILLTDKKNQHIIIENKIYAGEQENQLLRYHKFDTNAPIVYLTLYGELPTSTGGKKEVEDKLICISYESDIVNWLERCEKHIANMPIISEIIKQYIHLIKHLTNQTMEDKEIKEVVDAIISKSAHIEAVKALSENSIWDITRQTIIIDLINNQLFGENGIGKELGLEGEYSGDKDFGKKEFQFWFYKKDWKYCINFYFNEAYEKIIYGIDVRDGNQERKVSAMKKFKERLRESTDDSWIWCRKFDEYDNISWYDLRTVGRKIFKDKISEIIKKVEDIM